MNEPKKDNNNCVRVNIFVKCDNKDKDSCGDEMWEKKDCKNDENCVCVNIFAKCKNGEWEKEDNCKKEDTCKNSCIVVNIFAECDR